MLELGSLKKDVVFFIGVIEILGTKLQRPGYSWTRASIPSGAHIRFKNIMLDNLTPWSWRTEIAFLAEPLKRMMQLQ
jgi:hypothetical protein